MERLVADEPSNYICVLPAKIKKIYFEHSDIARIIVLENGQYFVQKISTRVFFPVRGYLEASGLRKFIVDRFNIIENCFR